MKESTGQCEMDINKLFGLEPVDIEGVLSNPNATIEEMISAHDYTTALNNIQFAALNSMLNAVTKEKKFIIKRLKLLALKIKTRRIFSKENIEELNQLLEDINYYIQDIKNDYELIQEIRRLYKELVKYTFGYHNEELAAILKYYIGKFEIIYNEMFQIYESPKDYVKLDFSTDELDALNKDILRLGLGVKHE